MKIIIATILFIASIIGTAFGENFPETNSTANSASHLSVDSHNTYNSKVTESPSLIQAGKIDGSNVAIPGAYWNKPDGDATLPKYYKDLGFHVADLGVNEISIMEIKAISGWWFFNTAISTGESPIEKSEDKIKLLNHFPKGPDIKRVSYDYSRNKSDKQIPFASAYQSFWKAYERGGHANNALLLYKVTPITKGDILALGLAGVNSTAHAGGDNPGKSVSSGAIGSGIGTASSWVWDGCYYLVIFFNKGQDNPVAKTEEVRKEKQDFWNLENAKEVFFDFNKYELKYKSQFEAIQANVELIDQLLSKLGPNQVFCFFGKTSEEGTIKLNQVLGRNRTHAVYVLTLRKLHFEKGYDLAYLKSKIVFSSDGKEFPNHKELEKNREVCLKVVAN